MSEHWFETAACGLLQTPARLLYTAAADRRSAKGSTRRSLIDMSKDKGGNQYHTIRYLPDKHAVVWRMIGREQQPSGYTEWTADVLRSNSLPSHEPIHLQE